ncbi:MAG: hypothetical protein ACYS6K_03085 [Planctomycetota bacterium]|jgi:hypothetical protein
MIKEHVKKAAFIYTRPPGKCGIATITADSIVNSKLASEEGFERIAFILLSAILQSMIFCTKWV